MDMENKGGYPHPQPAMHMPMPPTYDQSAGYPPHPQHQHHHHGPPPPGQGMYPPMPPLPEQQQHHHIHYVPPPQPPIVSEPVSHTVIVTPAVGPDPTMVCCPSCRQTVVSRMEYENSTRTHVAAGLCCIFGLWVCCCLPYCMDSCRNGNHYCPNCGSFLGTYRS